MISRIFFLSLFAMFLVFISGGMTPDVFASTFQQLQSNGDVPVRGIQWNGIHVTSSSSLVGEEVNSVCFWLSRLNTSTLGDTYVRVVDVNENVKHTFGNVDVSTLPVGINLVGRKIMFNDAPYTLQSDDRIILQYPTSLVSGHQIAAKMWGSGPVFDGQNTQRIAHGLSGWVSTPTTDMKFAMDTGNDNSVCTQSDPPVDPPIPSFSFNFGSQFEIGDPAVIRIVDPDANKFKVIINYLPPTYN